MDEYDDDDGGRHVSLRSMGSDDADDDDEAHAPSPCPARLEMGGGGGFGTSRRGGRLGGIAAALEEARGDGAAGVPETPLRRPGSGARSRVLERGAGGSGDGSCSPVGGYAGLDRWGVRVSEQPDERCCGYGRGYSDSMLRLCARVNKSVTHARLRFLRLGPTVT